MKNFNEKSVINMVENLFSINKNNVKHAKNLNYYSSNNNTYFLVFGEKFINVFINGNLKKRFSVSKVENFNDAEKYAKKLYLEMIKYCI